ncbi:hypothetical protein TrVGV298_000983 [Trichoderma virens]|nr:hypothetical protein TrVGV298_000983 [Trichoderma virens]
MSSVIRQREQTTVYGPRQVPSWKQPSHPDVQQVVVSGADFMTKSLSKVTVPPFGLFVKLEFPPCTLANEPTYATVQMGKDEHLNLNSDLLYINHSCEPSLHFDMRNMKIVAGPKGLKPGDELTPTCKKIITGAKDMPSQLLDGLWLNDHIHELLDEQELLQHHGSLAENGGLGLLRRGITSRELSGEMGGDTIAKA